MMGFNRSQIDTEWRTIVWLLARISKPRLRVRITRMVWESPYPRFVGPDGSIGLFHLYDTGQGLQQGWRAFCDEHLRCLGYDVLTLAENGRQVSGKTDTSFPLTGADAPALPASAGFP